MIRELHTTERPSATAQWTAFGRAVELGRPEKERIVSDPYAPLFLSPPARRVLTALRAGGGSLRRLERSEFASVATSVLCRHRFLDEQLLLALPDVTQVVVLGAGYDTRAYRWREAIDTRRVFEVDLAPLSRRKAAIVAAHPERFAPTTIDRVEIDFRTQTLPDRLADAGFVAGAPTFVVWEGVALYLSREAVIATLAAVGEVCGRGSVLGMDGWQHVGGLRPYDQLRRVGERAIRLIGEPLTFAAEPDVMGALLDGAGFTVTDVADAEDLERRYATGGRRCDRGLYLVAARRR